MRPVFQEVRSLHPEGPDGDPEAEPELDDETPLEIDDVDWDALLPDDDYEPAPERGDFWTEDDSVAPSFGWKEQSSTGDQSRPCTAR